MSYRECTLSRSSSILLFISSVEKYTFTEFDESISMELVVSFELERATSLILCHLVLRQRINIEPPILNVFPGGLAEPARQNADDTRADFHGRGNVGSTTICRCNVGHNSV